MRLGLDQIRSSLEPIVSDLGCELVDVKLVTEHGRAILRVFIDKEGGLQVGDCQKVSREIDTLLDVESGIRDRYDLEVSSPGLDRPLVKEADFSKFAGKKISLKTKTPIDGRQNYKGLLHGIEERRIRMTIDGKEYQIPFEQVERAKVVYE